MSTTVRPAVGSFYPARPAKVNKSLTESAAGAVNLPLRAACERAGIGRCTLAGLLFDGILSAPVRDDLPHFAIGRAALDVLRQLLDHANAAHDRVFASVACLAEETGRSTSTIDLVLTYLRRIKAIRLVDDPTELYAGDGPHNAKSRGYKRRGRWPVNTYDLSGLARFLPNWLYRMLFPITPKPATAPHDHSFAVSHHTPVMSDLPPNPFLEGHDNVVVVSHVVAQVIVTTEPGWSEKTPPAAAPLRGFLARNFGNRIKDPKNPLRAVGIRGVLLSRMGGRGSDWCDQLVAYGRATEARDGEKRGPGWYVATWREWESGNGSWPDWFEAKAERITVRRVISTPRPVEVSPIAETVNSAFAALRARVKTKRLSFKERINGPLQHAERVRPTKRDGRCDSGPLRADSDTNTVGGGGGSGQRERAAHPPGGGGTENLRDLGSGRGFPVGHGPDPAAGLSQRSCDRGIPSDTGPLAHLRDRAVRPVAEGAPTLRKLTTEGTN